MSFSLSISFYVGWQTWLAGRIETFHSSDSVVFPKFCSIPRSCFENLNLVERWSCAKKKYHLWKKERISVWCVCSATSVWVSIIIVILFLTNEEALCVCVISVYVCCVTTNKVLFTGLNRLCMCTSYVHRGNRRNTAIQWKKKNTKK